MVPRGVAKKPSRIRHRKHIRQTRQTSAGTQACYIWLFARQHTAWCQVQCRQPWLMKSRYPETRCAYASLRQTRSAEPKRRVAMPTHTGNVACWPSCLAVTVRSSLKVTNQLTIGTSDSEKWTVRDVRHKVNVPLNVTSKAYSSYGAVQHNSIGTPRNWSAPKCWSGTSTYAYWYSSLVYVRHMV